MTHADDRPAVIVTGAAGGIGAAVAAAFAARDSRLILSSLTCDDLAPVQSTVEELGGEAVLAPGDVRDPLESERLVEIALARFGRLDALICCAGVIDRGEIVAADPARWSEVIETNLLGTAFAARAGAVAMVEQGFGDIVLMASISGREAYPGEAIYIASKWGLVGFGHALRKEVSSHGVRVTLLEPGLVDSTMTRSHPATRHMLESGDSLDPADIGELVTFIVRQPPHVTLAEVAVRPTRQPDIVAIAGEPV